MQLIVHYATSAMKRFLTSVSLQHEPKTSDVITLVKKTFFARVSYEILYHEVWNKTYYYYMFQSFLKMFNYSLDRNRVCKIKIAYPRNVFIYKMNEIVMFNLQ